MALLIVEPQWVWHHLVTASGGCHSLAALGSRFCLWQCLVGTPASPTTTKKGTKAWGVMSELKFHVEAYRYPLEVR